jgi:ABC-type amino acid transport substrate-binding protein
MRQSNAPGIDCFSIAYALVLATVATATSIAQARPLTEILKTKELRACIAFVSPTQGKAEPAGCRDNCTLSGDAPDLTLAFAKSLGADVKVKGISIGWEEQFTNKEGKVVQADAYTPELFAANTCDLYATNFAKNEWRAKKMNFVMVNPSRLEVVINQNNKDKLRTQATLKGKTIATYTNSVYHAWVMEQNAGAFKADPIKVLEIANEGEAMQAVEDGKADFSLLIAEDALPLAGHRYPKTTIAFAVGKKLEMGWAFRKDDKDLQRAADKFFRAQRSDPNSLLNKQFKALFNMSVAEFSRMVSK